jgi:TolA-binding protein
MKKRVGLTNCALAVGLGIATFLGGCVRERILVYCPPVNNASNDYEREYQRAYAFYQCNKFWEALRIFSALRDRNPNHPLVDNAQYWVGECYFDLKDQARATAELEKVLVNYLHSDKCEAALYKLGKHYFEMGCRQKASCYFLQLHEEHPQGPYGREAESYLKRCGMSPCR